MSHDEAEWPASINSRMEGGARRAASISEIFDIYSLLQSHFIGDLPDTDIAGCFYSGSSSGTQILKIVNTPSRIVTCNYSDLAA